jgi:hypothetical protein
VMTSKSAASARRARAAGVAAPGAAWLPTARGSRAGRAVRAMIVAGGLTYWPIARAATWASCKERSIRSVRRSGGCPMVPAATSSMRPNRLLPGHSIRSTSSPRWR